MATTVTGCSDDLIELDGDLYEEFGGLYSDPRGIIGFSDGTLVKFEYDDDGIWRFKLIVKGELFDHIEQGDVEKDTFDVVHFKDGLKWAVMGTSEYALRS